MMSIIIVDIYTGETLSLPFPLTLSSPGLTVFYMLCATDRQQKSWKKKLDDEFYQRNTNDRAILHGVITTLPVSCSLPTANHWWPSTRERNNEDKMSTHYNSFRDNLSLKLIRNKIILVFDI